MHERIKKIKNSTEQLHSAAVLKSYQSSFKGLIMSALMVLSCFMGNVGAAEISLGLTPSHVYGLWENINNATIKLSELHSEDEAWLERQANMQTSSFSGKKPSDVLERLEQFRDKLDRIKIRQGLSQTEIHHLDDGVKITPGIVFLNTGYVLDSMVLTVVPKLHSGDVISPFFKMKNIKNKTPSDVYALVDLANRRLDKLLSQINL